MTIGIILILLALGPKGPLALRTEVRKLIFRPIGDRELFGGLEGTLAGEEDRGDRT